MGVSNTHTHTHTYTRARTNTDTHTDTHIHTHSLTQSLTHLFITRLVIVQKLHPRYQRQTLQTSNVHLLSSQDDAEVVDEDAAEDEAEDEDEANDRASVAERGI